MAVLKMNGLFGFLFFSTGIVALYLTYGWVQEGLYRVRPDGTKFGFTSFLLFAQCLSSGVLGGIAMLVTDFLSNRKPSSENRLWNAQPDLARIGLAYVFAMGFSNEAIKYISYPFQALVKSCKTIPVMLGQWLVGGKTHPFYKYVCMTVMAAAVGAFQVIHVLKKMAAKEAAAGGTEAGSGAEGGEGEDQEGTWDAIIGFGLLVGSLACDAYVGPSQEVSIKRHQLTSSELMLFQNLWAAGAMLLLSLWTGELPRAVAFVQLHPAVVTDIALFCTCSGLGQMLIYGMIANFDSLLLTTVTTIRKFLTILVSVLGKGHRLEPAQWVAVAAVFGAIAYDKFHKAAFRAIGWSVAGLKRPTRPDGEPAQEEEEEEAPDGQGSKEETPPTAPAEASKPAGPLRQRRT